MSTMKAAEAGAGRISGAQVDSNPKRSSRNIAAAVDAFSSQPGHLSAPGLPLTPSLGPYLQVQSGFADRNAQWIVAALQSGVKSEVAAALNALALLAYSEKDVPRREHALLSKLPGLLDALLDLIAEWRNTFSNDYLSRRMLRSSLLPERLYGGFGIAESSLENNRDPLHYLRMMPDAESADGTLPSGTRLAQQDIEWAEEGLFNLDDVGRAEKQKAAVAASNVLRSISFLPESAPTMAAHRHCLEVLFLCMLDHETEDEELVTNAVDAVVNIAPYIDLRQFAEANKGQEEDVLGEEELLSALKGMLEAPVKAWQYGASEALSRLLLNPDNEAMLVPFGMQVFERLSTLLGRGDPEVQGAAVAAIAAYAELGSSCRAQLGRQRWVIPRLIFVIRAPHPLNDVCRRAASALESLASEWKNREVFAAYEQQIAELAMQESKCADQMARVLWELTSDVTSSENVKWSVWGA